MIAYKSVGIEWFILVGTKETGKKSTPAAASAPHNIIERPRAPGKWSGKNSWNHFLTNFSSCFSVIRLDYMAFKISMCVCMCVVTDHVEEEFVSLVVLRVHVFEEVLQGNEDNDLPAALQAPSPGPMQTWRVHVAY